MSSRPPRSRRTTRPADTRPASGPRWALPLLGGGIVVVAAVLAVVLSAQGQGSAGSSAPSSGGAAVSVAPSVAPVSEPVIEGAALPAFANPTGDPAIGSPAPVVTGVAFDGSATGIAADGRPKVVLFIAHWCPHCQAEVPAIQAWLDAAGAPEGVDLVSVVTAIDASRPNYPPDAWLQREGWTVPVIADPSGTVGGAYGLTAFPFWTFIGADGTVRARAVGELSIADLEASIRSLRD